MPGLEKSIEVSEAGKEGLAFGECPRRPLPEQTIMQTLSGEKQVYDPILQKET